MDFYDGLIAATTEQGNQFLAIPILQRALQSGVPKELYLAFLGQAYHHVRHTCPLLEEAAAHCTAADVAYRSALEDYIDEERGHETWILDDIRALDGNADAVRAALPSLPCRLMVAYVYYAIRNISPYSMLGMVHVLEGMSVALAQAGAASLQRSLGLQGDAGFSYLTSHGALDQAHVGFFRTVVNGVTDVAHQAAIIDAAQIVYGLYGDIFRGLDADFHGADRAA